MLTVPLSPPLWETIIFWQFQTLENNFLDSLQMETQQIFVMMDNLAFGLLLIQILNSLRENTEKVDKKLNQEKS